MKHIVKYVEQNTPKLMIFKTLKAMNQFIVDFRQKYGHHDDNWIEFKATHITGNIVMMDAAVGVSYEQNSRGKIR